MFKGLRERRWAGQGQERLCAQEACGHGASLLLPGTADTSSGLEPNSASWSPNLA